MKKLNISLTFIALSYILVCLGMYVSQTSLIFPAHLVDAATINPKFKSENITFITDDETNLQGITFNPKKNTEELFIVYAGNAHNAETLAQDVYKVFSNATVTGINYRGYGRSAGTPSQKHLFADALKQLDYLSEKFSPKRIYFVGYSLGTGVVSYLLSQHAVAGAFMLTPFDALSALAKNNYPYLPVDMLIKHPFNNVQHLQNNKTPLAVITVKDDSIVPQKNLRNFLKNVRTVVFHSELSGITHGHLFHHKNIAETLQKAKSALH